MALRFAQKQQTLGRVAKKSVFSVRPTRSLVVRANGEPKVQLLCLGSPGLSGSAGDR